MELTNPIQITANRKNDTIYIVEHVSSENAKETATDKVKRLVLDEAGKRDIVTSRKN